MNLPLEEMRTFIGEDYKGAKAFGIYKDETGAYYEEPMDYSNLPNPMKDVNADQKNTGRTGKIRTCCWLRKLMRRQRVRSMSRDTCPHNHS